MRRVQLTDQALVAVSAAREAAAARRRSPAAADLLVGLAAEPDGRAGRRLRQADTAASRLVHRAAAVPPGLPALDDVVARAAERTRRPVATSDLLAALLEAGGADVADLLAACGYDPRELYRSATQETAAGGETFGLGSDPDLSAAAATAVARVRADAGGAVDLVVALAATPDGEALVTMDPDELVRLRGSLHAEEHEAGDQWDRGLAAVLDTARAWREPPVGTADLLRAARTAGGVGPARLLQRAESSPASADLRNRQY